MTHGDERCAPGHPGGLRRRGDPPIPRGDEEDRARSSSAATAPALSGSSDGEVYGADATTSLPFREAVVAAGLRHRGAVGPPPGSDASAACRCPTRSRRHARDRPSERPDRLIQSRIVDTVFELTVTSAADFEFRGGERHPLVGGRQHSVDDLIACEPREARTLARGGDGAAFDRGGRHPRRRRRRQTRRISSSRQQTWRSSLTSTASRSIADITRLLGASAFDVCATLHRLVTAGAASVV